MADREAELEEAKRRRQETSHRIVGSDADKRLIIAGPGTGKTYNFRGALEAVGGGGLALTFIRALVRDLARDLDGLAQANTFHGYCKYLAHSLGVEGLTSNFDYYPPFLILAGEDMELLGMPGVGRPELERALQNLDDSDGLITKLLEIGGYYDAVSHTDVVYRVLLRLRADSDAIPKWPLVVVDEYQDFSKLETEFIEVLSSVSPVLVAGDDDQALYTFKHASANFIRELAERDDYERFDLPNCSRCTEVIVGAVNNVVDEAQSRGDLAERLDKEYLCYLPDKLEDSEAHPAIIHAACSTETNRARYMGRYVVEQVGRVPETDIVESHKEGYPTVLVIGRRHFVKRVYDDLKKVFPQAVYRPSPDLTVDLLDGYRRLARNARARLAWRIVIHERPFGGWQDELKKILAGAELFDCLQSDYRDEHLRIAEIVRKILDDELVEGDEVRVLEDGVGQSLDEIRAALGRDEEGAAEAEQESEGPDENAPTIICTSLLGAKGLSAAYVFLVGFIDGEFPNDPRKPTDDEICKLLVALSRTRKACHLVSSGRFGENWASPSSFLAWLGVDIDERVVNKEYWA